MAIFTLLKSNIKKKKGVFISIAILTAIIVAVLTSTISVKDNFDKALEESFETTGDGDIVAFIRDDLLTQDHLDKVSSNKMVDEVKVLDSFCVYGLQYGEIQRGNTCYGTKLTEGVRLINDNINGYIDEIPVLNEGEIYVPLGLKAELKCEKGDKVTLNFIDNVKMDFTIKGFVEEPFFGAMNIGYKLLVFSDSDFVKIKERFTQYDLENEDVDFNHKILVISQSDNCDLSLNKFQRQLNIETKIFDIATATSNRAQGINYATLMAYMILDVIWVFVILLFVIVLIIMSHSISQEIEMDYTMLGILKSQGMTSSIIRSLFIIQYLLAQAFGIIVGFALALPLQMIVCNSFKESIAVIPQIEISVLWSLLVVIAIMILSAALIIVKTHRIKKISPLEAINGGIKSVHFDNAIRIPVSKKFLSFTIGCRQFTSAWTSYLGTIVIVGILIFFMISVNLFGSMLGSKTILNQMGITLYDLDVYKMKPDVEFEWEDIDNIVSENSKILERGSNSGVYATLNGENLFMEIIEFPEYVNGMIEGRSALYENEILTTPMVAEILELEVGDEVKVCYLQNEKDFVVSGIFQSTNDAGMCFATNYAAIEGIVDNVKPNYRSYIVEDKTKLQTIKDALNEKYGDGLGVVTYSEDDNYMVQEYNYIVNGLRIIIYVITLIFSFIVIRMVCMRFFIKEKIDIGIYKAIGVTNNRLRLIFAVRFLIVALTGSAFGIVLSLIFSKSLMQIILKMMGFYEVILNYTVGTVAIPIVFIAVAFSMFAYVISRRVKNNQVRELVVE